MMTDNYKKIIGILLNKEIPIIFDSFRNRDKYIHSVPYITDIPLSYQWSLFDTISDSNNEYELVIYDINDNKNFDKVLCTMKYPIKTPPQIIVEDILRAITN